MLKMITKLLHRKYLILVVLVMLFSLYSIVKQIFWRNTTTELRGTNPQCVQTDSDFVFILPRHVNINDNKENLRLSHGIEHLSKLLDGLSNDFDGATCHGLRGIHNQHNLERIKTCQFTVKQWSLVISNGDYRQVTVVGQTYKVCNMVEVPFLIRRTVLNKFGFRRSLGELTLMDFFLRTNETLQIVATQNCTFLREQLVIDRGAMIKKQVYLDYRLLGYYHSILRIIRQDTVTWTTCSKIAAFCPEVPLQMRNDTDIPCCDQRLDEFLIDVVEGLERLGTDYRICYGTHLGAWRSKTIIPWTQDIDICLTTKDYTSKLFLEKFKGVMEPKYAVSYISRLVRVIAMYPFTKKISDRTKLFGDSLVNVMKKMGPIKKPTNHYSLDYTDIYPLDRVFHGEPAEMLINGRRYLAYNDSKTILLAWYGKTYWKIDARKYAVNFPMPKLPEKQPSTTQEDV